MKETRLIIGFYGRGTYRSDRETEAAYKHFHKPLITKLYNSSSLPIVLYYPGLFLKWLGARHQEAFQVLSELGSVKKQIEFLGGAFYEPILPIWENTDRVGQIELMTTEIRKNFRKRCRGFWIPQGLWYSELVNNLAQGNMVYTFLDEWFFSQSSLESTPHLTENQGKHVLVIPRSEKYESLFYEEGAEALLNAVQTRMLQGKGQKPNIFSLFFDIEKLNKERREALMSFLETAQDDSRIHLTLPGKILKEGTGWPLGYFPESGYANWDPEYTGRKIGNIRQIFTASPQLRTLYARTLYSSLLVNRIKGDRSRKDTARRDIWESQNHLLYRGKPDTDIPQRLFRQIPYRSLLRAEDTAKESFLAGRKSLLTSYDFDLDGVPEYLYHGSRYNLYVHRRGGSLFELDFLKNPWNYLALFPRRSFQDSFLSPDLYELSSLEESLYEEEECNKDKNRFLLSTEAFSARHEKLFRLEKQFFLESNRFKIVYTLQNQKTTVLNGFFCVKMYFSFSDIARNTWSTAKESGSFAEWVDRKEENTLLIQDNSRKTEFELSGNRAADLRFDHFYEKNREYDFSCLYWLWPLSAEAGEKETRELTLTLKK